MEIAATHLSAEELANKDQALLKAAKEQDWVRVMILVAAGADVNAQDEEGNTALYYAAAHQQLIIINYLKKHGARGTGNKIFLTPLGWELLANYGLLVEVLIDGGDEVGEDEGQAPAASSSSIRGDFWGSLWGAFK